MPYPELQGKTALITGASRGFGRAIALRLAQEGVQIVVNYRRSRSEAEETAAAIEAHGARAVVIRANMAEEGELERLVAEGLAELGRIDIFVHNAAFGQLGPLLDVKARHWETTLQVCAKTLLQAAQALAPSMQANGGGVLLSITSDGGQRVLPGYGAVGPAKAAMESLTRYLAVELGGLGIRVNGLHAGLVDTPSFRAIPGSERLLELAVERTPAGRGITAQDAANVAAFLCSDEAAMIRGQFIVVDGGLSLLAMA